MKMHHSSESQSVTRPLLGMNRNRTAEPQRAPKIYMWTPEDASTRWSQRQADTFKQQAMKLISERRRNVRRTSSFFCIVLNWVIFFFFPGATFFFSSLHKLFSGIFLHVIWTLSVKRGCSCFKTVKTFFLYLYFFLFFLHVKLSENKFQKETYIFILCYIWNRNIFSLTMTFSSRRIFSSEIKIKWFLFIHVKLSQNRETRDKLFLRIFFHFISHKKCLIIKKNYQ